MSMAGLGDEVTVVVVFPFATCNTTVPELLLNFPSPAYVAVNMSAPALAGVSWQVPVAFTSVIVQLAPVVSVTLTEPPGEPLTAGKTVAVTFTAVPNKAGFEDTVTVTLVFSVKVTMKDWFALCAGGPGSATDTLKVYIPGTAV